MNRHETHAVSLTIDATTLAPLFLPLLELPAGAQLLASQCSAHRARRAVAARGGTSCSSRRGRRSAIRARARCTSATSLTLYEGEARVLPGSAPLLDAAVLFGLYVAVQAMPEGATVDGHAEPGALGGTHAAGQSARDLYDGACVSWA